MKRNKIIYGGRNHGKTLAQVQRDWIGEIKFEKLLGDNGFQAFIDYLRDSVEKSMGLNLKNIYIPPPPNRTHQPETLKTDFL